MGPWESVPASGRLWRRRRWTVRCALPVGAWRERDRAKAGKTSGRPSSLRPARGVQARGHERDCEMTSPTLEVPVSFAASRHGGMSVIARAPAGREILYRTVARGPSRATTRSSRCCTACLKLTASAV
jgi:hypothetical protein